MQAATFIISTETPTSVDPSVIVTEVSVPMTTLLLLEPLVPDEVEEELEPVVQKSMDLLGSRDDDDQGGLLEGK